MRTFIAISFDATIRRRLSELQARLGPRCPKLKWVDPGNMHLTVKFLGRTDDQKVASIGRGLDELAGRCRPFDIAVDNVGCFNPRGPVRIVRVGVQDLGGGLAACHGLCEQLIAPLGFPTEKRSFSPHLTLARNKIPAGSRQIHAALEQEPQFHAGTQTVTGIILFKSNLTAKGPIYTVLSSHKFSMAALDRSQTEEPRA